ncbi:hypothetical protein F5Y17DRAFT_478695 [Xylariaceae sp. FL0594]|nr:hypothetical protein F5Y17DRAFT_478695 [Xylariaceae sp. FL0594]
MATSFLSNSSGLGRPAGNANTGDGDSDYGSDFSVGEEQLVEKLLQDVASSSGTQAATRGSPNDDDANEHNGLGSGNGQRHAPFTTFNRATISSPRNPTTTRLTRELSPNSEVSDTWSRGQADVSSDSIGYPDLSRALSTLDPKEDEALRHDLSPPPPSSGKGADTRSPLQRFRTFPRRPLTVTDMAAGAWCELQYWYTLTRLPGGRKPKTPAMRAGTRVHQTLEDQVHTPVQVDIVSKEEAFALRLWNIVQGLRTLRDTGLTRELEVWGQVEGEIFNGVIDQLSHESPNSSFEEELNMSNPSSQQSSIEGFLGRRNKTVYLTDIKTRGSDRLPNGIALRPARVQLFLYHRLLSGMASDELDYSAILDRYGINGEARFSDGFIAQMGGLHDEIFYDADSEVESDAPDAQAPDLIRYRSVSQIIPLLRDELKETFPLGSASIGNLLSVQYRHREDGRILGNNSFPNDSGALEAYMKDNLRWWRGDREPEGVNIEETFKCGLCEFAESCQWRKDKEVEFLKKKRAMQTSTTSNSSTGT